MLPLQAFSQSSVDWTKKNNFIKEALKDKTLPKVIPSFLTQSSLSFHENSMEKLIQISNTEMKKGILQAGGPPPFDKKILKNMAKIIKKEMNETQSDSCLESAYAHEKELTSASKFGSTYFKKLMVNFLIG